MQEEEYGKHSRKKGRMWPGPLNGEEDGVDPYTHRVSLSKRNHQRMRSSQGCRQQDYCGKGTAAQAHDINLRAFLNL